MEVAEDSSVGPAEHRLRLEVCMGLKYVSSVCGTVGHRERSLWERQIQVGEPCKLI